MRKTFTALLLAAALPTLAFAAPGMGDGHGYHKRGDCPHGSHMMMRGLDLSAEQHQQLRSHKRAQMQEHQAIIQRYLDKLPAAEQEAMQKEIQANRDKADKAIRDSLTPEQQKRHDELQKEREARSAERAEFEAWKAERAKQAE